MFFVVLLFVGHSSSKRAMFVLQTWRRPALEENSLSTSPVKNGT